MACHVVLGAKYLARVSIENGGALGKQYLHTDMLGSVRAITDAAGQVVARFDYEPFGLLTGSSGSVPGGERYTGKPYDAAAGLYYFGARYYDPQVGRFTASDPAQQGLNWYTYCANNPLNRVDADGNSWTSWLGGVGETIAKAWYKLNGWEILWTTSGHGSDFVAWQPATKQFALVDAKAWLNSGTVSKLVWATQANLGKWTKAISDAIAKTQVPLMHAEPPPNRPSESPGNWGRTYLSKSRDSPSSVSFRWVRLCRMMGSQSIRYRSLAQPRRLRLRISTTHLSLR